MRDELPHSIAVVVEEMGLREGRRRTGRCSTSTRTSSSSATRQKGIVIGHRGARLQARSARAARKQIEAMLGTPVYLDLRVKIAKDWQRDPKQLRRLGLLSRRRGQAPSPGVAGAGRRSANVGDIGQAGDPAVAEVLARAPTGRGVGHSQP